MLNHIQPFSTFKVCLPWNRFIQAIEFSVFLKSLMNEEVVVPTTNMQCCTSVAPNRIWITEHLLSEIIYIWRHPRWLNRFKKSRNCNNWRHPWHLLPEPRLGITVVLAHLECNQKESKMFMFCWTVWPNGKTSNQRSFEMLSLRKKFKNVIELKGKNDVRNDQVCEGKVG